MLHENRVRRAPVTSIDYRLQIHHAWPDFARVGCCPCFTSVHGIQFLDSFLLSLSLCSRTCTLCKGGVMIRLLGFW